MRRFAYVVFLVGCGGDDASGPALEVTTSFTVMSVTGAGTSSLDALAAQTIDFDIVWDAVDYNAGEGNDPPGCKTRLYGFAPSAKTSHSALVQSDVIDKLDGWSLNFQLCDSGQPSISLDSAINELNLAIGCGGIPPTAVRRDAGGSPVLTTFTATDCSATILDVSNNRVVQSAGFTMAITTGRGELP